MSPERHPVLFWTIAPVLAVVGLPVAIASAVLAAAATVAVPGAFVVAVVAVLALLFG